MTYKIVELLIMKSKSALNSTKLIPKVLIGLMVILAILHVASVIVSNYYSHINIAFMAPWFDLDTEGNVPTVYNGLLLGCCAFISVVLITQTIRLYERFIWSLLSLFFLYAAFDEILVIHERFGEPVRELLHISHDSPFFHAWVVIALAIVAVIITIAILIKRSEPMSKFQKSILIYVAILGTGMILIEVIGTQFYFSNAIYKLGPVFLEEMFEIGMISFILTKLSAKVLK